MRKLLIVLCLLLPLLGIGQAIRFSPVRLQTIYEPFKMTIPQSTWIFIDDSNMIYKVTAQFVSADSMITVLNSGNYVRLFSMGASKWTKAGFYLLPKEGEYLKYPKAEGTGDSIVITEGNINKKRKAGAWLHGSDSTRFWNNEVAIDDENNWILPFIIRTTAVVIYNGMPLRSDQWSIVSSATLVVSLDVRKYDYLQVIN
jgi:hypothetical protein